MFQYIHHYRLDEDYVVKVGDFGLARDNYACLYYCADKNSQIPVKVVWPRNTE